MEPIKRVKVKFLDSIAGLKDPTPAALELKYKRLSDDMTAEKLGKNRRYTDYEVKAAVEAERKRDEQVIRSGFAKDYAFKPDQEAMINADIAEAWEAAGICVVIVENAKKAA